jgi:hypothetical protein
MIDFYIVGTDLDTIDRPGIHYLASSLPGWEASY